MIEGQEQLTPNPKYEPEIEKLAKGLEERGIEFVSHPLYDGFQIVVDKKWDAICHSGSYGHEQGLLEIMILVKETSGYTIEGWLSAEDILERVDKQGGCKK